VKVGTNCIDTYEASVWRVPNPTTTNKSLVAKIQQGRATAAELAQGGATQLSGDYAPCASSGQNCVNDIYAVSLPGVLPSSDITWFQAQQACTNAGKRLPSNAEWQAAVAGTPDPGGDNGTTDCNTHSVLTAVNTGSRSNCVSARGAFDMVGNLEEWVADWVPQSTACGTWSAGASPTGDMQCLLGAATTGDPGALLRGGYFIGGALNGPLAVDGGLSPSLTAGVIGFRCAR
jgi:formylglycine-generating enzyme required for sulfatase activity